MSQVDSSKLHALRGAISVDRNEKTAILTATRQLIEELMGRNDLKAERMVSCIFTSTADLDAEFPAVAARELGLGQVPLLCSQEIAVPGSLQRCIRVMIHYYAAASHRPEHVYLGEARSLRSDLQAAQ